jgi:hypothetical protein
VEERRHKKAFDLPLREDEGWPAALAPKRLHSHPVFGETVAQALARDFDERKKAGLLTSGSFYWLRLTASLRSGFMEFSSPVTAALPHRIHTCFPILPGFCPGHFLADVSRVSGTAIKELEVG